MATVAHVVAKIIRRQPHLEDFIERDLVSFHRLARYLMPEIKAELGGEINEGAVVMALSRLKDKMVSGRHEASASLPWSEIELSTRSGVVEIDVQRTERAFGKIGALRSLIKKPQQDVFNVVQGQYETTIIVSEKYRAQVLSALKGEKILHVEGNLALLYLRFPQEILYVPGFFDRSLRELSWANINVFELISTLTELILVIKDDDVSRAYSVLRSAFSSAGKR